MFLKRAIPLLAALVLLVQFAQAQYFGRNKPNYENFDFKVIQSPTFEMYHYFDNREFVVDFLNQAEEWHDLHQRVLRDTFAERNPLIIYANHADFQQTNTISGAIGVGTGGVTEALKNRVILPIAMTNQQTHHVLGHELVHAFQYNMILNGDSTNLRSLGNLPLWMVEGLAEYMSIGSVDALTAMWMRDAVLHDDVPTLKELNSGRYFPYRYGQAFWAFVTGLQGDDIIAPLFTATAKYGLDQACREILGMSLENLSELWVQAVNRQYEPYVGDKKERFIGKELIGKDEGGKMNLSPEISPNGRYVIFLSEKDVFSIDLFLADARTGKVIRKVASSTRASHIDDFSYIESSGTWSPDGNQFAIVAVSKGDNILVIYDTESGKTVKEARLKGVPAFSNPAWSPDGKTIVVSGLVDGQGDLYAYNVRNDQVTQLTNDPYSELHASWSADGTRLYFSTDELSIRQDRRQNGAWHFNLAVMDMVGGSVEHIDVFPGTDNLNPEEDLNGNIVFLSNRDGFRNLYSYNPSTKELLQLTDLITGVSGITHYAPAFSIDRKRNRLVYTYFSQKGYRIYQAGVEDLLTKPVEASAVDMAAAALPRLNRRAPLVVDNLLENALITEDKLPSTQLLDTKYRSKFRLDYVGGGAGVGVGTNNVFGTTSGVAGGVDLLFSDILGNNQLFTSLSLNGEITDFGGMVGYLNRKNRLNWGASISHVPYRSITGIEFEPLDTLQVGDNFALFDRQSYFLQRLFEQQVSVFAHLPFSSVLRLEGGASFAHYGVRVDRYDNYYYPNSFAFYGQDRVKVESGFPSFNLGRAELALVGDNSFFGLTAPLKGQRFRVGAEQYVGEFNFTSATADYRVYKFLKPVAFAFRALHYGRYGGNSADLFPLYVGSPWFVRGLNTNAAEQIIFGSGRSIDELLGTKLLVSNFEIRMPFTGPEQLALIRSGFLFTDINFFVDGGMAWTVQDQLRGDVTTPGTDGSPLLVYNEARPIFTTGVSLRVNLFGALVVEPFYAIPLVENTKGSFGINLLPGW